MTLSASNLPVVAFDLGAIAERCVLAGVGTILPLNATAAHINEKLLQSQLQTPLAHQRDMI